MEINRSQDFAIADSDASKSLQNEMFDCDCLREGAVGGLMSNEAPPPNPALRRVNMFHTPQYCLVLSKLPITDELFRELFLIFDK